MGINHEKNHYKSIMDIIRKINGICLYVEYWLC